MSKPQENLPVNVPQELIEELLTDSELRMVKQRLLILRLLKEGLSIRAIAERVGVGTDTVVRMARKLESSPKLKESFERFHSGNKPGSQWVFGKTKD